MKFHKKNVCIVTATRAEYGLLKPLIKALMKESDFQIDIVVTGAHLSQEYGLTYREIENDGFAISNRIPILIDNDTPAAISKTMGAALVGFGDYFEKNRPDLLIVLGDRYETLAVCCAALNARIPIAHIHGGETTEGAVDEAYRHSITKMSYLHFTSTEEFRKRVIQLGEEPERVYTVGAIGIENILFTELMEKEKLSNAIDIDLSKPYAIVTFHPVTLEENSAENQCRELLRAIDKFNNMNFIFTKANADAGGRIINMMIEHYSYIHDNAFLIDSLGMVKYLSAVKYASVVIGNSSSGIIEVPSFGIPTINIGDRQKGRPQSSSVINCLPICEEIIAAIHNSLSIEFRKISQSTQNPYGDGKTTEKIVRILKERLHNNMIDIKKKFYDIKF